MAHNEKPSDDAQSGDPQSDSESIIRKGCRVYNAKGELLAIINPSEPGTPVSHIGTDGIPVIVTLGKTMWPGPKVAPDSAKTDPET